MTKGQQDLIRYKLQRAEETLEEAKLMFQSEHFYGAANRLYYACFYAVTALLLAKNLSSSKHSGILSLFNKHFIKSRVMPVDMGKFYSRLFENRLESDYADIVMVDKKEIKQDVKTADEFISTIIGLIDLY